jgi:hypothetical protein
MAEAEGYKTPLCCSPSDNNNIELVSCTLPCNQCNLRNQCNHKKKKFKPKMQGLENKLEIEKLKNGKK